MYARRSQRSNADDAGLIRIGCLLGCFALPCSILAAEHGRWFALDGRRGRPLGLGSGITNSGIIGC